MTKAYDVILEGKVIDRVYYDDFTTADVRLHQINRRGYPISLVVKKVSERRELSKAR